MRKLICKALFLLLLLLLTSGPALGAQPRLGLPEPDYDFGTIVQGELVNHAFPVLNGGDAPLVVLKTKTSCGCTVAEKSFDLLAPGEMGEIRVRFDSTRFKNDIRKTIFLYTNDPAQPVARMHILGRVQPAAE